MQNRAPFNLKYTLVAYNLLMMYLNFHIFKEVSLIYRRSSKKHLGFSLAWTKLLRQRNFENLICCLKGWLPTLYISKHWIGVFLPVMYAIPFSPNLNSNNFSFFRSNKNKREKKQPEDALNSEIFIASINVF